MKTICRYIINGEGICGKEGMGLHRYTTEILRRLDRLAAEDIRKGQVEIWVVIPQNEQVRIPLQNIEVKRTVQPSGQSLRKRLWEQKVFPSFIKKHDGIGIDLSLAIPGKGCRYVAVFDCILEKFPESFPSLRGRLSRKAYQMRVRSAIRHGAELITISECSRKDLSTWYPVKPENIRIIGCSWEHMKEITPDVRILDRLKLKDREYFFALGSRYPYKNFNWILQAARYNPAATFVITGKSFDSQTDEKWQALPKEIQERICLTGYLSDGEIRALMQHCRAFIHPSYYEGFGLPPLEALSEGVPVIASHAASLPEILGDSVHYIDPSDPKVDLEQLLQEKTAPAADVLQKYSWDRAAETFYRTIIKRNEV